MIVAARLVIRVVTTACVLVVGVIIIEMHPVGRQDYDRRGAIVSAPIIDFGITVVLSIRQCTRVFVSVETVFLMYVPTVKGRIRGSSFALLAMQ
jgi:hypothetical protein